MCLTTATATSKPTTTIDSKILLKFSGSKSKPLDGAMRVKKISAPPYASTSDCDSSAVEVEMIASAFTVLLYEGDRGETRGTSGEYLLREEKGDSQQ